MKNHSQLINVRFQKISILSHRRDLNSLGGERFYKTKKFKEMYEANNWNFQRGGEVLEKILSMGEVWIFSGTTQFVPVCYTEFKGGGLFHLGGQ